MKNSTIMTALFFVGTLSGCESNKQKTEKAEADVNKATVELAKAQLKAETDSLKSVNVEEWKLFKNETEAKIKGHEIRISYLKKTLKQSRSKAEKELIEKIDSLENDTKSLKKRLENYDKVQSDWISFKSEFGHDMDKLGIALKDFTIPNK